MIREALQIAADPGKSTRESIDACRAALNAFWWVEYCAEVEK